jgi:hypothetical protein
MADSAKKGSKQKTPAKENSETTISDGSSVKEFNLETVMQMMNEMNQRTIEALLTRLASGTVTSTVTGSAEAKAEHGTPIISTGYEPKEPVLSLEKTLTPPKLTTTTNFTDWTMQFTSVLNVDGLDSLLDPSFKVSAEELNHPVTGARLRRKLALARAALYHLWIPHTSRSFAALTINRLQAPYGAHYMITSQAHRPTTCRHFIRSS